MQKPQDCRPIENRTFRKFLPLEGRIHVVEVNRIDGSYTAKAYLGKDFYPLSKGHNKVDYPIVALSIGNGFSTLRDAVRSLRKDLVFDAWARASIKARVKSALAQSHDADPHSSRVSP